MKKACLECGWEVSSADDPSRTERSRRALDHFVDTGHTIETLPEVADFDELG